MAEEGYWCGKCVKFVLGVRGIFRHRDLGDKTCLVCGKCGSMVYLKERPKLQEA